MSEFQDNWSIVKSYIEKHLATVLTRKQLQSPKDHMLRMLELYDVRTSELANAIIAKETVDAEFAASLAILSERDSEVARLKAECEEFRSKEPPKSEDKPETSEPVVIPETVVIVLEEPPAQ